jgi:integration host factor subunit beta
LPGTLKILYFAAR